MRLLAKRAAWMAVLAGSVTGVAVAGHTHTHATGSGLHRAAMGGAWWEHEGACCQHWISQPSDKIRAAYDEESGRSSLNYPPHRFADHLHMKLEVRIPDMNTPRLEGKATLTVAALGMPLPELTLDCGPDSIMKITGVSLAGGSTTRNAGYTHEGEELRVTIDPPAPVGERFDIVITYTLTDPTEGITWTPESPAWPGRPAQLHTQGQPESNHYWFPCHDFPNERLTTEIIATVPSGYTVVSNGALHSRSPSAASAPGEETFHWVQDKEHVNYLVTMVVGKFDAVQLGDSSFPMTVYAPLGQGKNVKQTYGRTGAMVRAFSAFIDEAYPWAKYDQIIAHNFGAGGMENTSATTMYDTAVLDDTALLDGDLDGLIAHELAHQWFGDFMTCNSWEHLWLNEGFATYFSHLWFEERDGKDAYFSGMYGTQRSVAARDQANAPYQPAMCSKEYAHPWEAFGRAANPYSKGASILHMLRMQVGDDLFKKSVRDYVDSVKGKTVETDDLRYAFERVTGRSFDRFFRQWCYRPGVPNVNVDLAWDSSSSSLNVTLKQTQNIDGYNPAFFFTMPIWVLEPGSAKEGRWLEVSMDARETSQSFKLNGEPTVVAVNPNLAVLAEVNVNQSADRWIAQMKDSPTVAAKMQAVDALRTLAQNAGQPNVAAGAALGEIVRSNHAHHALRSAAAGALFQVAGADAALRVFRQLPDDARVRNAVVDSAAEMYKSIAARSDNSPARFIDDLRQIARRDASYAVRAAAVRQLGRIGGSEVRPVIVDSLNVPSQHDQIRRAAIDTLGEMDDAANLDLVLKFTASGTPARTRPDAIQAVGRLAHHDKTKAVSALAALLDDRESRTFRSVGEALVGIGGPAATQAIEAYMSRTTSGAAKAMAEKWMKQLKEAAAVE